MIPLLLALLAPSQNTEQMMVRPSTEAMAVEDFGASCMGSLYNRAAVIKAAAVSPRKYVMTPTTADAQVTSWNSSWGSLHYVQPAPGTRAETLPQCNLTAFTRNPVDRKKLDGAISDMIDQKVRSRVTEAHRGDHIAWSWTDGEGRGMTLVSVLDKKTPQQITLSLQSVEAPK
jgi:hypothetical protein